jgi:hypothetical protein
MEIFLGVKNRLFTTQKNNSVCIFIFVGIKMIIYEKIRWSKNFRNYLFILFRLALHQK